MTGLASLYRSLADALDGPLPIEARGRQALMQYADRAGSSLEAAVELPAEMLAVMTAPDAHPCCHRLATTPLPWAPPVTTDDPAYLEVSKRKVLVELVGPEGLARSDTIRMGVYGMLRDVEYGIRTHPAEEIFVILAGRAQWLKGSERYEDCGPGTRRHHSPMVPHATRTRDLAFMSIYIWDGDIAFDGYVYSGPPEKS